VIKYYLPSYYPILRSLLALSSKNGSIADDYVLKTCEDSITAETTVLHRLRNNKYGLAPKEVASECKDHLSAGIDTTGDSLCFLMWQLSQPESLYVQEKLYLELTAKSHLGIHNLPYLDAVVKEGLRCFPAIPMSLPRYIPAGGRVVDGFFIPVKTIVSCQAYTMHRIDADIFPKPDQFIPERWIETDGAVERERMTFVFGAGGRGCIGKRSVSHLLFRLC
jgi:cytochrome P450